MSDRSGLLFHACFPHTRPTAEWYTTLLRQLWERGLEYSLAQNEGLTWESAFQAKARCTVVSGRLQFKEVPNLATFVEQMTTAEAGYVEAGTSALTLELQLVAENPAFFPKGTRLSWLSLWTDKYEVLPPDDRLASCQGPEYLQTYQAFLEWSAVLCALCHPLYGFGYSFWQTYSEVDPRVLFEQQEAERVLGGGPPAIEQILDPLLLHYLSPTLALPERLLAALETPGTAVKRLRNGGALIIAERLPFTYQARAAHQHLAQNHEKRGDAILHVLRAEAEGE